MNTQAVLALRGRNPDVLTCIANLSNDEVFTIQCPSCKVKLCVPIREAGQINCPRCRD